MQVVSYRMLSFLKVILIVMIGVPFILYALSMAYIILLGFSPGIEFIGLWFEENIIQHTSATSIFKKILNFYIFAGPLLIGFMGFFSKKGSLENMSLDQGGFLRVGNKRIQITSAKASFVNWGLRSGILGNMGTVVKIKTGLFSSISIGCKHIKPNYFTSSELGHTMSIDFEIQKADEYIQFVEYLKEYSDFFEGNFGERDIQSNDRSGNVRTFQLNASKLSKKSIFKTVVFFYGAIFGGSWLVMNIALRYDFSKDLGTSLMLIICFLVIGGIIFFSQKRSKKYVLSIDTIHPKNRIIRVSLKGRDVLSESFVGGEYELSQAVNIAHTGFGNIKGTSMGIKIMFRGGKKFSVGALVMSGYKWTESYEKFKSSSMDYMVSTQDFIDIVDALGLKGRLVFHHKMSDDDLEFLQKLEKISLDEGETKKDH